MVLFQINREPISQHEPRRDRRSLVAHAGLGARRLDAS